MNKDSVTLADVVKNISGKKIISGKDFESKLLEKTDMKNIFKLHSLSIFQTLILKSNTEYKDNLLSVEELNKYIKENIPDTSVSATVLDSSEFAPKRFDHDFSISVIKNLCFWQSKALPNYVAIIVG